jgi:outer membrane protein with beta-barrel domain
MRIAAVALAMIVSLSLPATAQGNAQTRQGFWISFGFGAGSLGCSDCNDDDEDRLNGINFNLRAGGTLSQRLLIGGEVNGWSKSQDGATLTLTNVGPTLLFYPSAQGGFFLKGGLGLASIEVDFGALNFEDEGVGLTIGLGFDARVGRNFALTPYFDILSSSFDGASFNQVAFGLGFTWP